MAYETEVLHARLSRATAALDSVAFIACENSQDTDKQIRRIRESLDAHGYRPGRHPLTAEDDSITRIWDNLITFPDIAVTCQVTEKTVHKWITEHRDFPAPAAGKLRRPGTAAWWWPELLAWLETNRLPRWSRSQVHGQAPGSQRILADANSRRARDAASTATRQAQEALDILGDNCPPRLAAVARLRLQYPDATISELAEHDGVTKDVIAGRLRRLFTAATQAKIARARDTAQPGT